MAKEPVSTGAIRRSTIMGLAVFGVFALLLVRILIIQTVNFDKYQSKVINQMTTESPVSADRGKIYDRNGNVLATNIGKHFNVAKMAAVNKFLRIYYARVMELEQ